MNAQEAAQNAKDSKEARIKTKTAKGLLVMRKHIEEISSMGHQMFEVDITVTDYREAVWHIQKVLRDDGFHVNLRNSIWSAYLAIIISW